MRIEQGRHEDKNKKDKDKDAGGSMRIEIKKEHTKNQKKVYNEDRRQGCRKYGGWCAEKENPKSAFSSQ